MAADFLRGKEDPAKLMVFVTQHQAREWKGVVESKDDERILDHKTDLPPMIVPAEAVALTAGIDVQKRGFWFVVRAWAEDLTSWLIHYGYLSSFADVATLIFETRYKIQDSEETLSISRAGMDTGGGAGEEGEWSRTEEIYQWIRAHGRGVVFGVKGASRPQLKRVSISVIDRLPRSTRPIRGGLELRILDTAQFKDLIHWRMTRGEHVADDGDILRESQRWYLHAETGLDYARQITAEENCRDRRKKVIWTRIRRDNHLLDCEVIAAACADSEWLPSLAMLAARFRRDAEKNIPPTLTSEAGMKKNQRVSRW